MATAAVSIETTARTLTKGEPLPLHLNEPFLLLQRIDPEWVWIAESRNEAVGVLIAAPCHGIAMVLRVKMAEGAPRIALLVLLRRFFDDLRARDIIGYMSWFDESSQDEKVLEKIAVATGGMIVRRPGVAVASWLPREDA